MKTGYKYFITFFTFSILGAQLEQAQSKMEADLLEKSKLLLQAVENNNIDEAKKALEAGACVNFTEIRPIESGMVCSDTYPLTIAARNQNLAMVKLLLDAKAHPYPDHNSLFDELPLFAAIFSDGVEIAKALIKTNANFDNQFLRFLASSNWSKMVIQKKLTAEEFETLNTVHINEALYLVCSRQNLDVEMIKLLVDSKADVNNGALHHAINCYSLLAVKTLISLGANVNLHIDRTKYDSHHSRHIGYPLNASINSILSDFDSDHTATNMSNAFDIFNMLLNAKALPIEYAADGETPILQLVIKRTNKHYEDRAKKLFTLLLDNGAELRELNTDKKDAYSVADTFSGMNSIYRLIRRRPILTGRRVQDSFTFPKPLVQIIVGYLYIIPNASEQLRDSAEEHDFEQANIAIAAGADVNYQHQAALYAACTSGQIDLFKLLIDAKADLNQKNLDSLLHDSCSSNQLHAVNELIQLKADVNSQDNYRKYAPLHQTDHTDIVHALVKAKANIEAVNDLQETPLVWAAFGNNIDVVKAFIHLKANIDAVNLRNESALYQACYNRNIAMVKLLLESGINFYLHVPECFRLFREYEECHQIPAGKDEIIDYIKELNNEAPHVISKIRTIPLPLAKIIWSYAFSLEDVLHDIQKQTQDKE